MALEIPHDLINEIQATTRQNANLLSYNPNGDLTVSISSRDAISLLDPSPDYLRCKHCNGRLLNGVGSIICVFCGTHPDTRPDSVNFSSTLAYRWLLDSLDLEGSEIVRLPIDGPAEDIGRERNPLAGSDVSLSKFLDLEVQWTAPEARTTINGKILEFLNLGDDGMSDIEIHDVQNNPGTIKEEENCWEANFQFASAPDAVESKHIGAEGNNFTNFDTFSVPSSNKIDSDHLDLAFGASGKQNKNNIINGFVSRADDGFFESGNILSAPVVDSGLHHDVISFNAPVIDSGLHHDVGSFNAPVIDSGLHHDVISFNAPVIDSGLRHDLVSFNAPVIDSGLHNDVISLNTSSSFDVDWLRGNQWQSVRSVSGWKGLSDPWENNMPGTDGGDKANEFLLGTSDSFDAADPQVSDMYVKPADDPPSTAFLCSSVSNPTDPVWNKGASDCSDINNGDVRNRSGTSNDVDMEAIMSEIHDLTFMLARELSVPNE